MKKIFLLFSLMIATVCANAQNSETVLPLVKYRITKADGSIATPANLNKNKPVMVIYFEPTCSHCEHLMAELKPKMDQLKKIQVVMITYTKTEGPYLKMIADFNKKYNLAKYPNFTVGTEYTDGKNYPVQLYYGIYNTPYVVVYNTKGKVVRSFTLVPKVEDLLAAVKKA
jgi:thiol-disulfide isomerase/thioredoxin